ncbi:hypothetical protein [Agrobacterium cavarae]|uniref:hypothetical protein n=1 Tax=Agrobacterium cavarae TaxID=2528239 RepID=UPI002FD9A5DA
MPIRRQHRYLYPIDWQQITDYIRFERAGGRCEHCRRPHGQTVTHLGDGRWWDETDQTWRDDRGRVLKRLKTPVLDTALKTTLVFLATAHLDNNPGHNDRRNLKALCQRCHMAYDRQEHQRRRRISFLMSRAIGDLFEGRYIAP